MNKDETRGMLLGLFAVSAFSVTLPATRIAVFEIHPLVIGFGRSFIAGVLAAIILIATRQRFPGFQHFKSFAIIAGGAVFGFPVLSAWAMQTVHASHGAVLIGILPLATAVAGALRAGDRPSISFWVWAAVGSAIVVGFSIFKGAGKLQPADLLLLLSLMAGAISYAEGARLARIIGGWQVICWTLVFALPITSAFFGISVFKHGLSASYPALVSLAYVSLISQLFGFFPWYHALAIGGVARVGQVQLIQPFLTLFGSALLLGEKLEWFTLLAASLVVLTLIAGKKSVIWNKQKQFTPKSGLGKQLMDAFDHRAKSA